MGIIDGTGKLALGPLPDSTTRRSPLVVQKVLQPGPRGFRGISAFCFTTDDFVMPPGDNTTTSLLPVENTEWMGRGQPLWLEGAGCVVVSSIPNETFAFVVNPGTLGNFPEGAVARSGSKVSPGGFGVGAGSTTSSIPPPPTASGQYTLVVPQVGSPFWDPVGGYGITSFGGVTATKVVGESIPSVTFVSTANLVPSSAIISLSGTSTGSSPITPGLNMSGTIMGPFLGNVNGDRLTVTLTCVFPDGTRTVSQSVTWADRTYQGVGGAGATSATVNGTNVSLVGGAAGGYVLTGTGPILGVVGQTFTLNVNNKKVYDLVPHSATPHTYMNGLIPFGMSPPRTFTFVNENGVSELWDLYESAYALSGIYTITRAT